jgi:hypothetical protein
LGAAYGDTVLWTVQAAKSSIKIMSFLKEFRDFAMKGSVIDLAIGVIIGAAFGKIVSALVRLQRIVLVLVLERRVLAGWL